MRAFWIALETLDLTTIRLLERVDHALAADPDAQQA